MKFLIIALVALAADSSWTNRHADPSRFTLLDTFKAKWPSTMSPSGDTVAHFSGKNVELIAVGPGNTGRISTGHRGGIHDSGWSLNGRILATTGEAGDVLTWDVRTGRMLARISTPHTGFA